MAPFRQLAGKPADVIDTVAGKVTVIDEENVHVVKSRTGGNTTRRSPRGES